MLWWYVITLRYVTLRYVTIEVENRLKQISQSQKRNSIAKAKYFLKLGSICESVCGECTGAQS
jgi:hypothetical protein